METKYYENEFYVAQKHANVFAIKLSISRQGIDPDKINRQDFDKILNYNMTLMTAREKAQEKIAKVNNELAIEHNELVFRIQEVIAKYLPAPAQLPTTPANAPTPHIHMEESGKEKKQQ